MSGQTRLADAGSLRQLLGAATRRQGDSRRHRGGGGAAAPIVEMLDTKERLPWAGHIARHALAKCTTDQAQQTTLVFVNTAASRNAVARISGG